MGLAQRLFYSLLGALALGMVWSSSALAADSASKAGALSIRIEGNGWGPTRTPEIEALLRAVADQLVPNPGVRRNTVILVSRGVGDPITRFEKGPHGEYLVELSASDKNWGQFAYQFGHELCHILSNFEAHADERKQNQWFEEALCETAALYTLRRLAAAWALDAPYPSWRDHAPLLSAYAARFLAEPHRQLPEGTSLAAWLAETTRELNDNPYMRDKNEVVANRLLPLFEADPQRWAALAYLNLDATDASSEFSGYLAHWQRNAPAEYQPFVSDVLSLLGVPVAQGVAEASVLPAKVAETRVQAGRSGIED
jgi:hypothetical protein